MHPANAKGKKKVRGPRTPVVKTAAVTVEMAMEVDDEIREIKPPCPEPPNLTDMERNGLERRYGWTKSTYQTMPVLRGTMVDMPQQLAYLREKVKDAERERDQERV